MFLYWPLLAVPQKPPCFAVVPNQILALQRQSTAQSVKQNESTNCNKTIGFEDFKKGKKRSVRPDFSLRGRKLKAVSTKSKAKEIEVSINIGFFKMEASGNLKRCLGKTLPVKVRPKRSRQDFVPALLQNMAASEELQGDTILELRPFTFFLFTSVLLCTSVFFFCLRFAFLRFAFFFCV